VTANKTFDPAFFLSLKNAEAGYFWFRVRRQWIADCLLRHIISPANILEIGCGTGNVSSYLATRGYEVTGCEFYKYALDVSWPGFNKVRGDALILPFGDNTFDIVGLFDVIEHFDNDRAVLREAYRVLKKGGFLVVTVPARSELWSNVDEISFHKRRYTKGNLTSILTAEAFLLLSVEYMFMMLYLPMKLLRGKKDEVSDHFKISKAINSLMTIYFECERVISRFVKLPIGTSLIAIAKK
jgi:SAM-dependent methyltransferase